MEVKRVLLIVLLIGSIAYYLIVNPLTSGYYGMPMMHSSYQQNLGYVDIIVLWVGLSSFTLLVLDIFTKLMKSNNKALEILNMRLSSGKISIEEYQKYKEEINRGN